MISFFRIGLSGLLAILALSACNKDPVAPTNGDPNPVDTTHHTDTTHHDTTAAPAPKPATIKILGTFTAAVGQSASLSVEVKDSTGKVLTPGTIAWSSSDTTMIAVSGSGAVTPRRIGSAVIRAAQGTLRDSVVFTSSLPPYTFEFDAGTPDSIQQLIRDGVQYAHAFHQSVLGRVIQQPTKVSGKISDPGCTNGGSATFTGSKAVTFCLANPGWMMPKTTLKQKIVQHEVFHVWQFEYGWISNPNTSGATWAIEGAAELMGFKGIAALNLLPFPTALGCQVKESADFATRTPPGLPALSTVEARQAFQTTVGPLYTHSMLAMDYLTKTNGLMALKVYGDAIAAGTEWHTAFETAFGMSTTAFYAAFPTYVSGLAVPPNYQCGI